MTFWDDPQMVINHIRHSCVTSDDTGMCEMVIVKDEPDIMTSRRRKISKMGSHHNDDGYEFGDYSQSFDIAVSPGLTGRTPRPARGGDKAKKRNNDFHMETVQWKDREKDISCSERREMFAQKELSNGHSNLKSSRVAVSLLSQLVVDTTIVPHNPFLEYSKFDGEGAETSCVTKSLEIFLAFLPEDEHGMVLSISITVSGNACVQDVIGLILFKASIRGILPKVKTDVKAYSLYIAEDDGEVDIDFPALDDKESITRFGFTSLALLEKNAPAKPQPTPPKKQTGDIVVLVNVPHSGFSRVKVDRTDVKMKQVLAKLVKKRGLGNKIGRAYILEKQHEAGKAVDLEATLESMGTLEFMLLREGGKRPQTTPKPVTDNVQEEFSSLQYKSYRVLMIHRLLATTDVQLGVYGKRIDIDPLTPKSTKFWPKMRPTSLDTTDIADSEITEERVGRSSFRIHYKKGEDYKHYDFEAQPSTADEIVKKINIILNTRLSSVRTEYLLLKERKMADRTTKRQTLKVHLN